MKKDLLRRAINLNKRRKFRKGWQSLVRTLALCVVFCTTYVLILPAITMQEEPICGIEAHTHTDACYGQPLTGCVLPDDGVVAHLHGDLCRNDTGILVCTLEEKALHTHDDGCYALTPTLACPVTHVHTEACRKTEKVLTCTLPETEGHAHSESCSGTQLVQVCTAEIHTHGEDCFQEQTLTCEIPETEGHAHSESCSGTRQVQVCTDKTHQHTEDCFQEQTLTCEIPETEGHAHSESCSGTQLVQVCTVEIHQHTEDCYQEQTPTCEIPEAEGHAHEESCYTVTEIPCTEPTAEEHVHEDTCWQQTSQLTCTLPELRLHSHGEGCYDAEGNLTCTLPVVVEHIHSEACVSAPENGEPVLVCTLQEHTHEEACYPLEEEPVLGLEFICGYAVHTHIDSCYHNDGSLACTIPEHTHNAMCVVKDLDLTADVETEEDWMKSVSGMTLTGNWPEDLLAVAETQLDYAESVKNVVLAGDTLKGYTRYGAWYGDPYADWNTLFAAFCLDYAAVEDFPVETDAALWVETLTQQELFKTPDVYSPKPGDLVFLDLDQSVKAPVPEAEAQEETPAETQETVPDENQEAVPVVADQVGIVAELVAATEETPAQLKLIAGDCQDRVSYVTYDLADPVIIGYGVVPDAKEGTYVCGQMNHVHSWACIGGEENCQQQAHTHTKACTIQTLHFDNETMQVRMTLKGFEGMPEDLSVQVVPVTSASEGDAYSAMVSAVGETMVESAYYVNDAVFYQVVLLSGGTVYELPEGVQADVQVTMLQPAFAPESIAASAGMRTFTLVEEIAEAAVEEMALYSASQEPMLLMALAEATTEPVPQPLLLENTQPDPVSYQAVEVPVDAAGNGQISFSYGSTVTFGVALTDVSTTTGLWKRVSSYADLNSGSDYLIVSVEGNFALNNAGRGTKVYIDSIKANEDYYTITDANGNPISLPGAYWSFSGSGTDYTVTSPYSSAYDYFIDLESSRVIDTEAWNNSADSLTLRYLSNEGGWTFSEGSTYMLNTGVLNNNTNSFTLGTSDAHSRTMLIFRSVSDPLEIPDDVVSRPNAGTDSESPDVPTYDAYLPVSEGLAGQSDYVTADGDGMKLSYFSDPATSQLESHFSIKTHGSVDAQKENNGMVHSDKSVIYGDDDYGAFENYDDNLFGVTLSALGQEFATGDKEKIHIPVDVMFILDISGSMNAEKVPGTNDTRSKAMVDAVNETIAEIMDRDPNNRVGAVLFSTGTGNLLELGRYTADNDQFLKLEQGSWTATGGSSYSFSGPFVYRGNTLRKDGVLYNSKSDVYSTQFNGTYTQAGIALGAQKLMAVEETTCDVTAFAGTPNETTIKVRRQPVIILLSDGEPTHSTSNYKDVLAGPHYGDGLASSDEYRGVHGYYTVLSANYYKRMVGIHYNQPAQFYSVGMGIEADGPNPASSSDDAYYKRAVLDPTSQRVSDAVNNSSYNRANTSVQLSQLLNNSYSGQYIKVTNGNQAYMPTWIGQVHEMVPVIDNPYAGNYSYADSAFFDNYNAAKLAETFGNILDLTEAVSEYGFILRSRTSLRMQDPVGEGMEVKGAPVLRYGGNNYAATGMTASEDGKTLTYVYDHFYQDNDGSGFTADLSNITVKIETDDNGLQTVHLTVPDYILPAYTPYMLGVGDDAVPKFYYEELPVRLIYQVGLTEEAQKEIDDIYLYGGEKVFYTNRYENDVIANATLLPTADNPFYMEHASHDGQHENCHHTDKTENLTGTVGSSFECHHALVDHLENGMIVQAPEVTQKLGNNGKLAVSESRKAFDIPVEKSWEMPVNELEIARITVELYSVTGDTATLTDTLELSQQDQWKGEFSGVPLPEDGSFYAIREIVPEGFMEFYRGEVVTITINGQREKAVKVQFEDPSDVPAVEIHNGSAYELPETGGMGSASHYAFGSVLCLAAALMYINKFGRKRQRGGASSQ